jgi:hypothetical protein
VFLVLDDVWQDKTFDSLDLAKGKEVSHCWALETCLYWKEQVHR